MAATLLPSARSADGRTDGRLFQRVPLTSLCLCSTRRPDRMGCAKQPTNTCTSVVYYSICAPYLFFFLFCFRVAVSALPRFCAHVVCVFGPFSWSYFFLLSSMLKLLQGALVRFVLFARFESLYVNGCQCPVCFLFTFVFVSHFCSQMLLFGACDCHHIPPPLAFRVRRSLTH